MTPHETLEHALSALVQGNIQEHIRLVADDVTWAINENPPRQGKSEYHYLITRMAGEEFLMEFQVDGTQIDSFGRSWFRVLEDCRTLWRGRHGRPRERTERVGGAYRVADGAITEIRMTALGGSNRWFTNPPRVSLP